MIRAAGLLGGLLGAGGPPPPAAAAPPPFRPSPCFCPPPQHTHTVHSTLSPRHQPHQPLALAAPLLHSDRRAAPPVLPQPTLPLLAARPHPAAGQGRRNAHFPLLSPPFLGPPPPGARATHHTTHACLILLRFTPISLATPARRLSLARDFVPPPPITIPPPPRAPGGRPRRAAPALKTQPVRRRTDAEKGGEKGRGKRRRECGALPVRGRRGAGIAPPRRPPAQRAALCLSVSLPSLPPTSLPIF